MTNDPKVEFYKTGVFSVLKRYDFTPEERGIIQAAISTAKKDKPNMLLIDKADALLKECTATREPKREEIDPIQAAKSIAKLRMSQYPKQKSVLRAPMDGPTQIFITVLVVGVMMVTINTFFGNDVERIIGSAAIPEQIQVHTFKEAEELCAKEGKVLPLTVYDVSGSKQRLTANTEYWLADRQVASIEHIMATGEGHAPKKEKHAYFCVDKNGKKTPF